MAVRDRNRWHAPRAQTLPDSSVAQELSLAVLPTPSHHFLETVLNVEGEQSAGTQPCLGRLARSFPQARLKLGLSGETGLPSSYRRPLWLPSPRMPLVNLSIPGHSPKPRWQC